MQKVYTVMNQKIGIPKQKKRTSNRPRVSKVLVAVATLVAILGFADAASAHVTVNPKTAAKGAYAKLTFRVPTEKDNASTTKLEVSIPTDKPIASVSIEPQPGWTYKVDKTTLATPLKTDDGQITEAVSKITWTADSTNAIKPGEFNEFNISAGPLPKDTDDVVFKAVQTYSDGDVVRWIELPSSTGEEPEHPAPTLKLTAAASDGQTATAPVNTAKSTKDDGAKNWAIAALVVGIVALLGSIASLATRRKQ